MLIVIKVGTQAILSSDGTLRDQVLLDIVRQIAELKNKGIKVVLVSSGAVGSGRRIARSHLGREYGHSMVEKQLLASLGQPELIREYALRFQQYKLLPSQILLTKQDFYTRKHYLNIAALLRETLAHENIIPVINENDSVAVEELMFTDNDELAGLIAAQLNADKLIVLTSVKGLYDKNPDDPEAKLISVINPNDNSYTISSVKTLQGRGGMHSKMMTARKVSDLGITTHIAHVNEEDVVLRIVKGEQVGTTIMPLIKKSSIKRWLVFNYQATSGHIEVNSCLGEILSGEQRVLSIMPVGITKCIGEFRKGDIVDIMLPEGQKIGVGIARYGADKLQEYIGQKHKPVFIHYDYLHILK